MKELICEHLQTHKKRYVFLSSLSYTVGKGLHNDIVLMDSQVPANLAKIEKKDQKFVWIQNTREVDLSRSSLVSHGFRFRVVEHQPKFFILLTLIALTSSFLVFQHFVAPKTVASSVVTLPAKGPFGNISEQDHVKNVLFTFPTKAGLFATLHYTSGNIEKESDLEILINNHFLTFSPISPNKWNVESKIFIPQSILEKKDNQIEFRYHGAGRPWGVKDIYVENRDDKPKTQSSAELLNTAEKFFHERNFKKGNLVRAIQILSKQKITLESKKKSLPEKYEKLLADAKEEKQQLILDYTMAAQKFKEGGYKDKANKIYNKLLLELIDPMDPDRTKILQEMREPS